MPLAGCPVRYPLRRYYALAAVPVVLLYRHLQPDFDQSKQGTVADASRYAFHQFVMRDRIELPAEVAINHLTVSPIQQPVNFTHCAMRAAPRLIPILLFGQISLKGSTVC